jgi:hypothetical protein
MPSDERAARVTAQLAGRLAAFRTALEAARDELRGYLELHRATDDVRLAGAIRSLGGFAAGRIDAARFDAVIADARALPPEAAARLDEGIAVLDEMLGRGDELVVRSVSSGQQLRRVVDTAFADIGRAFGVARMFRAVREASYHGTHHGSLLVGLPFARWSRAERELAPPLVVDVDGADLRAEHLVEYLDGGACIVLVVRGEASPAPLVRMIAPTTLVVQTSDVAALARLGEWTGAAVAAVLPPSCAAFAHDPRRGARLEERLEIERIPTAGASTIGWRSARQSSEELAQLVALDAVTRAARDVAVIVAPPLPPLPAGAERPAQASAVDVVASWLLAQAGLAAEGAR